MRHFLANDRKLPTQVEGKYAFPSESSVSNVQNILRATIFANRSDNSGGWKKGMLENPLRLRSSCEISTDRGLWRGSRKSPIFADRAKLEIFFFAGAFFPLSVFPFNAPFYLWSNPGSLTSNIFLW
ncbi:hypothetical protein JTE90_028800 [Oedothorax gibbosus]|uniref:Uncharacterized protein n=1 Tax=Oedothorax gibbosus TaxID=931172 RepID=A0AAV6VWU9_9ARAC|nr:hypothetical protein JTE90_028800 [Oedothorax gibbosus]